MAEQPAKKKITGTMIGIIVAIAVLLIGGGTFAGLVLGGVINLGGSSGGGLFSSNNLSVPTPEKVQEVCEKYNGTISTSSAEQAFVGANPVTMTTYTCTGAGEYGYIFQFFLFEESLVEIMKLTIADGSIKLPDSVLECQDRVGCMFFSWNTSSTRVTAIEDSDNYYKANMVRTIDYGTAPKQDWRSYESKIVAYDNMYIVIDTNDGREEQAEAILTDLGLNK